MYLLGDPMLPTVSIEPVTTSTLQARRSAGLLNDLCRIHIARVMHRDIQLYHIVIFDDAAKLIASGCSEKPAKQDCILGTIATASQNVLGAGLGGGVKIVYKSHDNL